MKVLVTGGAGFIGSHLVNELCKNHDVVVLDNLSSPDSKEKNVNRKTKFINGDIRDKEDVKRAMNGCEAVFHLAAISSVNAPDDAVYKTNLIGSKNVFEAARNRGAKIIFTSSAAVYGSVPVPHKESGECNPMNMYGKTKLKAEQAAKECCKNAFVARLFNVYGERGNGVVNIFSKRITDYNPITINGTGSQTRDFAHVDDVIRILIAGAENEGIYNAGTGKETSVLSIADMIFEITRCRPGINFAMPVSVEPLRSIADTTKVKNKGWQARISLRDGLKMLLADKIPKI